MIELFRTETGYVNIEGESINPNGVLFMDGDRVLMFATDLELENYMQNLPVVFDLSAHLIEVEAAVDALIESKLKQHWYKSLGDIAATALNTESRWNSEAVALNQWQGQCYELLEDYKLSVTEQTALSTEDFIDTLPKFDN